MISGCVRIQGADHVRSPYMKYVDDIICQHAKETARHEGLGLAGRGGRFMGEVERFDLHYMSKNSANISQARKIYVNATLRLIDQINSDTRIRPYLKDYPATTENVSISLRFEADPKVDDMVESVHRHGSSIWYIQWSDDSFKPIVVHEELYNEAVEIVQSQK